VKDNLTDIEDGVVGFSKSMADSIEIEGKWLELMG
jgi:hypothetical protein